MASVVNRRAAGVEVRSRVCRVSAEARSLGFMQGTIEAPAVISRKVTWSRYFSANEEGPATQPLVTMRTESWASSC